MPVARPRLAALALAVALALPAACATRPAPSGEGDAVFGEAPPPAPAPAPVTMTPVRFDAYVLALRNIRDAHPAFIESGASPTAIREEMRAQVARAGLTLEEFRTLHEQVDADPALKAEALHRLAAIPPRGSASGGAAPPATAPSPAP